ncbi:MAG: hypothetical protein AABX14_04870 [Candidatus Aenigmatarchaeota archaeon]
MKKIIIAAIIMVALIAGCTQQQTPITEISVQGHGNEIYTFSNDIRESLLVKTNNPEGIKAIGATFTDMNVVFDGSNQQDNAYFRVVLTNINAKLPLFYSYEGRLISFNAYYFIGDTWYRSANQTIEKPIFNGPVLWLSGPSTGATDTSLNLVNNTIYLSGTDYKNLTMAGDKLVLLFFGIDNIGNI